MKKLLKSTINKMLVLTIFVMFFLNIFTMPSVAQDNNKPDISILPNIIYDEELTEGEKSTFVVRIKNVGKENISDEDLEIFLFRDQIEDWVAFNSTTGDLDVGESMFLNISWTPDFGDDANHVLKIIVNYNQVFDERSFDNNVAFFPSIKISIPKVLTGF